MLTPELELLIEAEQMKVVIGSLKALSSQSDGVMINGELVAWEKALPLLKAVPDFTATSQQRETWMKGAADAWETLYFERVKALVAKRIGKDSTLESDNLYLWSLLSATNKVFSEVIRNTEAEKIRLINPNLEPAIKDLLAALEAVTSGALTTAHIRNELFLSGMDNVLMEFSMLSTLARNEGRKKDEEFFIRAISIISEFRQSTASELNP
ncbi:hypothetical protein AGJ34_21750 [Cronobacter dublinensis subsp. dublinensis]|nr:hypothetical protein [Cronobacter dublinensis subsp. dublinensis]EGT5729943.1 hypothetical protein [Cronobacter dublinensis subsp. dublinensis]